MDKPSENLKSTPASCRMVVNGYAGLFLGQQAPRKIKHLCRKGAGRKAGRKERGKKKVRVNPQVPAKLDTAATS